MSSGITVPRLLGCLEYLLSGLESSSQHMYPTYQYSLLHITERHVRVISAFRISILRRKIR